MAKTLKSEYHLFPNIEQWLGLGCKSETHNGSLPGPIIPAQQGFDFGIETPKYAMGPFKDLEFLPKKDLTWDWNKNP